MKCTLLHPCDCERNSQRAGEFPPQSASNAEMFPFDGVIITGANRTPLPMICLIPVIKFVHPVYEMFMNGL